MSLSFFYFHFYNFSFLFFSFVFKVSSGIFFFFSRICARRSYYLSVELIIREFGKPVADICMGLPRGTKAQAIQAALKKAGRLN